MTVILYSITSAFGTISFESFRVNAVGQIIARKTPNSTRETQGDPGRTKEENKEDAGNTDGVQCLRVTGNSKKKNIARKTPNSTRENQGEPKRGTNRKPENQPGMRAGIPACQKPIVLVVL